LKRKFKNLEYNTLEKSISYHVDIIQNSFSKNLKTFQLPLHKSAIVFHHKLYFINHVLKTLKSEENVHTCGTLYLKEFIIEPKYKKNHITSKRIRKIQKINSK